MERVEVNTGLLRLIGVVANGVAAMNVSHRWFVKREALEEYVRAL